MRSSTRRRDRIVWLLGVTAGAVVIAALLTDRRQRTVDPKWEMAIRSGMPIISAEPVAAPPPLAPSGVQKLNFHMNTLFIRTSLEAQTGEYLIFVASGAQSSLRSGVPVDRWRAFHLVLSPTQETTIRCYPRFERMADFEGDLYTDSPRLEAGKWYRVRIFVRLIRQLTEQPLRALRIDFLPPRPTDLRVAALEVELDQESAPTP